MPAPDRLKVARDVYGAYESGDRSVVERLLSDDFTFYSPADIGIDRTTYFERCWPNAEVLTFDDDDKICTAEVYFGWDIE